MVIEAVISSSSPDLITGMTGLACGAGVIPYLIHNRLCSYEITKLIIEAGGVIIAIGVLGMYILNSEMRNPDAQSVTSFLVGGALGHLAKVATEVVGGIRHAGKR